MATARTRPEVFQKLTKKLTTMNMTSIYDYLFVQHPLATSLAWGTVAVVISAFYFRRSIALFKLERSKRKLEKAAQLEKERLKWNSDKEARRLALLEIAPVVIERLTRMGFILYGDSPIDPGKSFSWYGHPKSIGTLTAVLNGVPYEINFTPEGVIEIGRVELSWKKTAPEGSVPSP